MKKQIASITLLILFVSSIIGASVFLNLNGGAQQFSKADEHFLELNKDNAYSGVDQSITTSSGQYAVPFSYSNVEEDSGYHCKLDSTSSLKNTSEIRYITSIYAAYDSTNDAKLMVRYSCDNFVWSEYFTIESSSTLDISKKPYFVEFKSSDEFVEIKNIRIDYSCSDNPDIDDLDDMGQEGIDTLTNSFTEDGGSYIANDYRCVKIFDDYFNKGTYQVNLSRTGSDVYDDYLIFAYNETNKSYYSFGLNLANYLQITYFDGNTLSLVKALDVPVTSSAKLSIAFDDVTGATSYFLNEVCVYTNKIDTDGNLKYGFYAGTKGCIFSNVMIDEDDTILDNGFDRYQTANGEVTYSDNAFNVVASATLTYHKTKTLKYGDIEATLNTADATNNAGIAFCIDNNGKTTFYREEGISYYYLCISINGSVALYRVEHTTATLVKNINTKQFYKDRNHTLKAIRDKHNVIHAFLDGVYCFSYNDLHPLKGDKFGISASSAGVKYYHFSAKATIGENDAAITNYDVVSGSFYKNSNVIVSSVSNSMIISKTPGTYNGTIEAEIAMGKNYGTGLVFRLTKPLTPTFYESESGLSYYWLDIKSNNRIIFGKVVEGNISWTIEKYMPYFMSNAAKCKIVLDGNNIYAYFTNILTFHYVDDNPLTGLYYGLRSDSKGTAIYGDITFSSNTEHEQNEYLIFGHSYTQLWHRYKEDFAQLGEDVNNIGIGGSQTITWSKQYKNEVVAYNPSWGIYWNGINDINSDVPVDTIVSRYSDCLLYLKEKLPNFKCVVISISRCTHEKAMARLDQIAETNQKLKELCDSYNWLLYVDAEEVFCDVDGQPIDSYFVDTLHPTSAGYKLVAPLVINAINNFHE